MGNNNDSKSFLQKGEGLRILSVKLNSPFDGKVEPFFDFIIDIIPLEPSKSPKQILQKLTASSPSNHTKDFNQTVLENEDRKLEMKIVSTKRRSVKSLIITPNRNWNGSKDLIGVSLRKQKYDEVFSTYAPIAQVQNGSPIQLAGIKDGEFLLGCLQFHYLTINQMTEGLYDRFFDKQIPNKHVHLAIYNMIEDEVSIKPVLLKRGWGGEGLLGCQFLQGHINKFPTNFSEKRLMLLEQQKKNIEMEKIKNQIEQCNGVSKALYEALKKKRNKIGKRMQNLKSIVSGQKSNSQAKIHCLILHQLESRKDENFSDQYDNLNQIKQQNFRILGLESKIGHLEQTLINLRKYLDEISHENIQLEKQFQLKQID